MNTGIITGLITKAHDLEYTPNGVAKRNFNIAGARGKNKHFTTITVWGKPAEWTLGEWEPGKAIFSHGKLTEWEDKDGNKRLQYRSEGAHLLRDYETMQEGNYTYLKDASNQFQLIGRVGRNAEKRSEKAPTTTSIAINEYDFKTKERITIWVNLRAWDSTLDGLQKGDEVAIIGSLENERYEKDGETINRSVVEVIRVVPLGEKREAVSISDEFPPEDDLPW